MERTVQVKDAVALMAAMAEHRIGVLKMPGLELTMLPGEKAAPSSANNITIPKVAAAPVTTQADAEKAIQAARIEAQRLADVRTAAWAQSSGLTEMQARTARARRRAAGGFTAGPSVGAMVDDLHKESLKTPRAPRTKGAGG